MEPESDKHEQTWHSTTSFIMDDSVDKQWVSGSILSLGCQIASAQFSITLSRHPRPLLLALLCQRSLMGGPGYPKEQTFAMSGVGALS